MVIGEDLYIPLRSEYIKIETIDDHYFYIRKEYGITQTFKAMLECPSENPENEVSVNGDSLMTQSACRYLAYKHRYTDVPPDIPLFTVPPEYMVELLILADFMRC
ncbi:hypothetical protein NPIL_555461 [Nephila pilipes]|uniref:Elongin-C n=1 Tax=Nephila pilipes TaxID=299642 RepID=A0A8X6TVG8_NEPPI|nr:hypothetical protein NPIL_555461 [Nephila pilipes]